MLLVLLVLSVVSIGHSKHVVVVLDTAITETQAPRVEEMKLALEQAYKKYMLPQDTHTLITFGEHDAETVFEREQNPAKIGEYIRHLKFATGCADWSRGLQRVNEGLEANSVYLIVDENPCGKNPSGQLYRLASAQIPLRIIGIGTKVSPKWAPEMTSVHSYRYLLRGHPQHKRDIVVREAVEALSGGEIAAVVIVSILLGLLLLISCGYALRHRINKNRAKPRYRQSQPQRV